MTNKEDKDKTKRALQHLISKTLLTYIFWNPGNLVLGAVSSQRINDPRSGIAIDSEIIDMQSNTYQTCIKIIDKTTTDARWK